MDGMMLLNLFFTEFQARFADFEALFIHCKYC